MFPVTSTKHVQLSSNFCNIELQLVNEDGTTIKPKTNSCGDTNKKDKTSNSSSLSNEIVGDANSSKDCHPENKTVDNDHVGFSDNLYKINSHSSLGCQFDTRITDKTLLASNNYGVKGFEPGGSTDFSGKELSHQQYLSKENQVFVNTECMEKNVLTKNITSTIDFLMCEEVSKNNEIVEDVQENNAVLSTTLDQRKQVALDDLQHSDVEMKVLAKHQINAEESLRNISSESSENMHQDNPTVVQGECTTEPKQIQLNYNKSPNFLKRQSATYGDIVKRFSSPLNQPIERSISEDIPVIVRRRGCTLRVRIASITEADLERLREVGFIKIVYSLHQEISIRIKYDSLPVNVMFV